MAEDTWEIPIIVPWGLWWKYVQMQGGLADEGLSCTSQESVRVCLKSYPDRGAGATNKDMACYILWLKTLKHLFPLG